MDRASKNLTSIILVVVDVTDGLGLVTVDVNVGVAMLRHSQALVMPSSPYVLEYLLRQRGGKNPGP